MGVSWNRGTPQPQFSSHPLLDGILSGCWLTYPSEKYESQLGWWTSQLNGKIKIHVPVTTNQLYYKPSSYWGFPMTIQAPDSATQSPSPLSCRWSQWDRCAVDTRGIRLRLRKRRQISDWERSMAGWLDCQLMVGAKHIKHWYNIYNGDNMLSKNIIQPYTTQLMVIIVIVDITWYNLNGKPFRLDLMRIATFTASHPATSPLPYLGLPDTFPSAHAVHSWHLEVEPPGCSAWTIFRWSKPSNTPQMEKKQIQYLGYYRGYLILVGKDYHEIWSLQIISTWWPFTSRT